MCVDVAIGLNVHDLCGPTDLTLSLSLRWVDPVWRCGLLFLFIHTVTDIAAATSAPSTFSETKNTIMLCIK
jgi:hypothetical protein